MARLRWPDQVKRSSGLGQEVPEVLEQHRKTAESWGPFLRVFAVSLALINAWRIKKLWKKWR
jgi:hypothetical protein